MTRFALYPRRAYSDLFKAWARANKKLLAMLMLGLCGLLVFETALILTLVPDGRFQWWFLGALQTALVAIALHLTSAAFLAHERQAIWQLRGAWGEEATRDELRRAKIHSAAVTPLIVIWGPAQDQVPENFQLDGIEFIGGRRLLNRLSTLAGEPVDRDAATDVLKRLKEFRANAGGSRHPRPLSSRSDEQPLPARNPWRDRRQHGESYESKETAG